MSLTLNSGCASKALLIPAVIVLVVIFEEVSFLYRKGRSERASLLTTSAEGLPDGSKLSRSGTNLIYWTPHKTGSTSMTWWIKQTVSYLGTRKVGSGIYYPYSNFTDHERRIKFLAENVSCRFVVGHIRIPPFDERFDERQLGVVITTTRRAFNTLASKFFHRTADKLTEQSLKAFQVLKSRESRRWFFYWHDSNPCEPLQYYDGLDHCDLDDDEDITLRAKRIAERIDCTVNMDNPSEDLETICAQLQIPAQFCPQFPDRNSRKGRSYYSDLYDLPHIRSAIEKNLRVTTILWQQLMNKRCRFLPSGNLTVPGYAEPRWPKVGCS